MRFSILLFSLIIACGAVPAQWSIQQSHTTANLRGIHALGGGIAWASGTQGTILHTIDDGTTWQTCTTPPDAEELDFRAIQAFDAQTAVVMSSGKGNLSRLYKTGDACKSWELVLTNPDKEGFWDAFVLDSGTSPKASSGGILFGDPVRGRFPVWKISRDLSPTHGHNGSHGPAAKKDEAAFAASNSAIFEGIDGFWLATGGVGGGRVIHAKTRGAYDLYTWTTYPASTVPVGSKTASSGIFSLAFAATPNSAPHEWERRISNVGVAVGGDYKSPDEDRRVAAFTEDGGLHWSASQSEPHGYRSPRGKSILASFRTS